jgi:hypothetical protein
MDINCHTPHLGRFCLPAASAASREVQQEDFLLYLRSDFVDFPQKKKSIIIAILNIN